MAKRTANHDINHDNWDQDLEHEEAGVFKRATDQDLTRRVVKTAKRRLGSGIPGSSDEVYNDNSSKISMIFFFNFNLDKFS